MRMRFFSVACAVAMAALVLTTPAAQADRVSTPEPNPPAPKPEFPAERVVKTVPTAGGPAVAVKRPNEAAEAPGEWMRCWIEQQGGAPHVRGSTGGAGVKAALRCDKPVSEMTLNGQMYYWNGFWYSASGSESNTRNAGKKILRNYDTTSPQCANGDATSWYGYFSGTVSLPEAGGGTVTDELELSSTEAELPCGPA